MERDFEVEPLLYVRKDAIFEIEEVRLLMENHSLVWLIEANQLVYGSHQLIQRSITPRCSTATSLSPKYRS